MKIVDEYIESIFPMDSFDGADKLKKKKKVGIKKNNFSMSNSEEEINSALGYHSHSGGSYTENFDPSDTRERVMVDFDGVIHDYKNGWQDGSIYGELIEGTKEAIDTFRELGLKITIFTTRASRAHNGPAERDNLVSQVENWLHEKDIYFDEITSEKLGAIAYIDDRGIRFENNWSDITNKIKDLIKIKEN